MKKDVVIALSFRLGERHRDKLRILSKSADVSQTDKIRTLIDREYRLVMKKREDRLQARQRNR